MKGILAINTIVVPMMLFFSVIVGFDYFSFDNPFGGDKWQVGQLLDLDWVISLFAYIALNLVTIQAVLVPLGSEVDRELELTIGGMLGGVGIGVILLINHLSMNSLMPDIMNYDIPMAEVIRDFGRSIHVLFILVIYSEIFTMLIGNVFGMTRQIQSMYRLLPTRLVILTILFSCYAVSQMSFAVLLSHLYAVFWVHRSYPACLPSSKTNTGEVAAALEYRREASNVSGLRAPLSIVSYRWF